MNDLFLPYKLAKLAKENGFDELCLRYYIKENRIGNNTKNFSGIKNSDKRTFRFVAAPLYQQILDWFRKEHEIYIYYQPYPYDKYILYSITYRDETGMWAEGTIKNIDEGIKAAFKLIKNLVHETNFDSKSNLKKL